MELEKLFNYNSILTIQTIAMFLGFILLPEVSEIVFLKTDADLRNMKIKCVCAWTFFPRLVQSGLHTFAAANLTVFGGCYVRRLVPPATCSKGFLWLEAEVVGVCKGNARANVGMTKLASVDSETFLFARISRSWWGGMRGWLAGWVGEGRERDAFAPCRS